MKTIDFLLRKWTFSPWLSMVRSNLSNYELKRGDGVRGEGRGNYFECAEEETVCLSW